MLGYRLQLLAQLGEPRENAWAEKFGFPGPATDGVDDPGPEELFATWREVGAALAARLEAATEEQLQEKVSGLQGEVELHRSLAFPVFHEAYHMGSAGTLLAEFALPTPSERFLAQMEQESPGAGRTTRAAGCDDRLSACYRGSVAARTTTRLTSSRAGLCAVWA